MRLICPHCQAEGEVVADAAGVGVCAGCGGELSVPVAVVEEGLSARRVRMLSARRRAMIRVRTWWAVAGGVLLMAAGGLGWAAVVSAWGGGAVGVREAALGLIAGACVVGFTLVARQVAAVSRAIAETALGEPESPPDFSGLGDGSERWRRLEEIGE